MLGHNKLHTRDAAHDGTSLEVNEVFKTLQGEGPFAGMPAVFVRLAYCNLRCHYCDTEFETHYDVDIGRLVIDVKFKMGIGNLVVITGGEPMRQNIAPFVKMLLDAHYLVQVETAGTLWWPDLDAVVEDKNFVIVCSPKTRNINSAIGLMCKHWKYIVAHDDCDSDGLPLRLTQRGTDGLISTIHAPVYRTHHGTIWVQPRAEYNEDGTPDDELTKLNTQHAVAVALKHGYRLSLQCHKILNIP